MCCSVLQCVAVCCSALRRVVTYRSFTIAVCICVAECCGLCVATFVAVCFVACDSMLQRVADCCSVLQCVAVCYFNVSFLLSN